MQNLFSKLNRFLVKQKTPFFGVLLVLVAIIVYIISDVKLEENLNSIIPEDKRISEISSVFNKSELADQIVFIVSHRDTGTVNPDILIEKAELLVDILERDSSLVEEISFKAENDIMIDVYNFIYENLPLFLSDKDYIEIKNKLSENEIEATIKKDFKSIISPAGMATKEFILKDPLSLTPIALNKLNQFKLDDNFNLYNSVVFTKDKKHLLFFLDPVHSSSNIQINRKLIELIDLTITSLSKDLEGLNLEYYGGTAIAVANSVRVKKDIVLTVSIAMIVLLLIFIAFFRRIRVIVLMFVPVILGALFSIAILTLMYGQVSAIAMGIGVIFIGISVDYSLHFFTHLRLHGSIIETIARISKPVLMSSLTTASAFLCLSIVKSEALKQVGIFTAIAVVISALSVLIVIPLFLTGNKKSGFYSMKSAGTGIIEKAVSYRFEKNKILVVIVLVLTIVFSFTSKNLQFNGDISTLNYLPEKLARAEASLNSISSIAKSTVYLVSQGETLDEALTKLKSKETLFEECKAEGLVSGWVSATDIMLPQNNQKERILKWNSYWEEADTDFVKNTIKEKGNKYHFNDNAFHEFYSLLEKEFEPIPLSSYDLLRNLMLKNFIATDDSTCSVLSILNVDAKNKNQIYKKFGGLKDLIIFDNQYFINQFFEMLKEDFKILVQLSMIVVFIILLIFFGRIEIAIITFIPISISWLWTMGLLGLFNIDINIFNIIISTFVFGLGIDYSIFIMNGLIANYSKGNHSLTPYKLSILLSAITTIAGVGVLIFAQHPALKSIAIVSILGISTVVIITYTLLPLLFSFLTRSKGKARSQPVNLLDFIISIVTFLLFLTASIILTLVLPILVLIPVRRRIKKYIISYVIFLFSNFIVGIIFPIKKRYIDRDKLDFSEPSVIISNHQSHLDLVLILMLHPKIIVLVNHWVWKNPFYGFIIRYADFYPIFKGLDHSFDKIRGKVDEGYSILVFPEASRTSDGEIKRFHQGAFGLADELGLDIQPIIIHGAYDCLPKTEFFLKSGKITLKYFNKIKVKPGNIEENITYRSQTKEVTAFYRNEYAKLQLILETPDYLRGKLIGKYVYKGPVLEWYLKVKLKLERNYTFFNDNIPREANIVDIGCGYGFLSMMLRLLSDRRNIVGIDYDDEKIGIAKHIARNIDGIDFESADISKDTIPAGDIYILNDVLHYLPQEMQLSVLGQCMDQLSDGGKIILRDTDTDLKRRTLYAKFTEYQSTKVFRFNKTQYDLNYLSGRTIKEYIESRDFTLNRFDNSKFTSNITYVITHKV
jgi:uncharacterized protein